MSRSSADLVPRGHVAGRVGADNRVRPGASSRIDPEEPADNFGFSDGMRCAIEPSIFAADRAARPFLYLDWLRARMMDLADVRGWDTEPLVTAFDACRAANGELRLESKPKSSPDRQHIAQLRMTRDPQGQAQITLSIQHRRTGDMTGQTIAVGYCNVQDFRRMSRQLRWTSKTDVIADDDHRTSRVPGLHQIAATVGTIQASPMIRPDWAEIAAVAAGISGVFDNMSPEPEPAAAADGDVEYEPDEYVPPVIYFVGGGPGAPDQEYGRVLSAAVGPLASSEEWARWWSAGHQPRCEIQFWIGGPSKQIRIHRNDKRVAVTITRGLERANPPDPGDLNPDPGAGAAKVDVAAMITKLRDRFGLGPPPALDAI